MGKLVCQVELDTTDATGGVKVTIENEDAKITQTMHFNGTKILTSVAKEGAETSKIEQLFDSITITCKTFAVNAETITCKSTKASKYQSDDVLDIKSVKD